MAFRRWRGTATPEESAPFFSFSFVASTRRYPERPHCGIPLGEEADPTLLRVLVARTRKTSQPGGLSGEDPENQQQIRLRGPYTLTDGAYRADR